MQYVRNWQVSAPRIYTPHVVGKLGADGQWHVQMRVPVQPPVWDGDVEVLLTADQADRLAKQLTDHAALLRDKAGLPGGKAFS